MIDANKTIEQLQAKYGKTLNEDERKAIEGFTAFMNLLWGNKEQSNSDGKVDNGYIPAST